MVLSVNLTLLVQIGNFIIAYFLIDRLLLRPGYEAVRADMNKQQKLKGTIVARQELIAHKQVFKADRWKLFRDHFHKQAPSLSKEIKLVHPLERAELPQLTVEQLAKLSKEISDSIKPMVIR
jgi:hypothetical protein